VQERVAEAAVWLVEKVEEFMFGEYADVGRFFLRVIDVFFLELKESV